MATKTKTKTKTEIPTIPTKIKQKPRTEDEDLLAIEQLEKDILNRTIPLTVADRLIDAGHLSVAKMDAHGRKHDRDLSTKKRRRRK